LSLKAKRDHHGFNLKFEGYEKPSLCKTCCTVPASACIFCPNFMKWELFTQLLQEVCFGCYVKFPPKYVASWHKCNSCFEWCSSCTHHQLKQWLHCSKLKCFHYMPWYHQLHMSWLMPTGSGVAGILLAWGKQFLFFLIREQHFWVFGVIVLKRKLTVTNFSSFTFLSYNADQTHMIAFCVLQLFTLSTIL